MNITRQQLWQAEYVDVVRLARWLRTSGVIQQPLPTGTSLSCRKAVIDAVARACGDEP